MGSSRSDAHPFKRSLALTVGLRSAGLAHAHARLVSADPAPNSTVSAPKQLELHFSESIAAKLSGFTLTDSHGKAIRCTPEALKAAKAWAAAPTSTLEAGVYTVSWTAVSTDDGHKMTGSYHFTVK